MKKYIVSWWCGQVVALAANESEAKARVASGSSWYKASGRGAPLFAKEVENA